jgi:hypothetical protein
MAEPIAPIILRLPVAADPATPRVATSSPERGDGLRQLLSGEA